ncbi:hypothetical protein EYF80_039946 [Liparis tanakae]|uniref:Uncharacterized protein n=1 Tax=Liparis tanakae TaxID=230148 RepID=A0A4Z2GA84_9TELE|nr:hypothetical protein EYF80_039946 [Liparis tanakae]
MYTHSESRANSDTFRTHLAYRGCPWSIAAVVRRHKAADVSCALHLHIRKWKPCQEKEDRLEELSILPSREESFNMRRGLSKLFVWHVMKMTSLTIQKRVPVANSAYCSMVDRTLKMRHTRTMTKLRGQNTVLQEVISTSSKEARRIDGHQQRWFVNLCVYGYSHEEVVEEASQSSGSLEEVVHIALHARLDVRGPEILPMMMHPARPRERERQRDGGRGGLAVRGLRVRGGAAAGKARSVIHLCGVEFH